MATSLTGSHAAEWELESEWIPGEVDLTESQPPSGSLFGVPASLRGIQGFPHEVEVGLVRGRMRQGQDVVFGGTTVSVWFPGRALLFPRWALVGLGIHDVPGGSYASLRMQVSGLESFFGTAPIESMTWPSNAASRTYSVTAHEEEVASWESDGLKITCCYEPRFAIGNAYRFEVAFAPLIEIEADQALTVEDWVNNWVNALLGLATLATGKPESVVWASLGRDVQEVLPGRPTEIRTRHAQLFGSGISQKPYLAQTPPFVHRKGRLPLFTLARLTQPLTDLVRRWRELEGGQDPFLELVRPLLFDRDMSPRARCLHLFQALEALHAHESQTEDAAKQERYELRRSEVLARLDVSDVEVEDRRFIKETWSSRRPDSLARRLRELIGWLPAERQQTIRALATTPLAVTLADQNAPIEDRLQRLRNDLSHGNTNPSVSELSPWADALESVARIHLLRVLGLTQADIAAATSTGAPQQSD